MPVLNFNPHFLESLSLTEEYEDENGDFHPGKEEWLRVCKCDVVPSGSANHITLPDGTALQYAYTVHLPKDVKEFSLGEKVRINFFENGSPEEKRCFTVKGFHRYQHKCKMWI